MKKVNGNCKAVRCLTDGKYYRSVTEAAEAEGVHISSISFAIRKNGKCNGKEFGFEINMEKNIMKMASNLSAREINREEMAEFYAWKAEREMERKAKEAKAKRITDLIAKADRQREIVAKAFAKWEMETNKLVAVERELESLTDEEVQ